MVEGQPLKERQGELAEERMDALFLIAEFLGLPSSLISTFTLPGLAQSFGCPF